MPDYIVIEDSEPKTQNDKTERTEVESPKVDKIKTKTDSSGYIFEDDFNNTPINRKIKDRNKNETPNRERRGSVRLIDLSTDDIVNNDNLLGNIHSTINRNNTNDSNTFNKDNFSTPKPTRTKYNKYNLTPKQKDISPTNNITPNSKSNSTNTSPVTR